MKDSTPRRCCDAKETQSPTTHMPESVWEGKWQNMVNHQRLRHEQDAVLRQKLKEKQEMEEYIECTFTPNTHLRSKTRNSAEVLEILKPLIAQEERILKELAKIDSEDENNVQQLSLALRTHIAVTHGRASDQLVRLCEEYREERLKELSKTKAKKLDVVGLLHELERNYKLICVKEGLSEEETERAGFNIETCRRIKKEIVDSIYGVNTLKDRSKVTSEIETIIKNGKDDIERQRLQAINNRFMPVGMRPMIGPKRMTPFINQMPNMMAAQQGFQSMPAMSPMMIRPNMMQQLPQNLAFPQPEQQLGATLPIQGNYPRMQIIQPNGTQVTPMVYPSFSGGNAKIGHVQPTQQRQPVILQRNVAKKLQH
ncbi:hypothetical protein BaOVIS_019890 [Babesia ovis]|uniref:Uncharacterized protein n=1 Tax=Babesia ovis TaxID=5869 RepID=A0A9W5WV22_BABOV|nr:hypothetical protein BaOVIS_019890 [Babesia ovis]